MKIRRTQRQRGLSLVEVMAALTILGIASLGLVGGVIISLNANGLAGRRTQMRSFAQSRIERLIATRPAIMPCGTPGALNYVADMDAGGPFDPAAAPGTGGWMMDTLDATSDVDGMAGPVLVDTTSMAGLDDHLTRAQTANTAMLAAVGPARTCLNAAIANDPSILCREIHVEQITVNGSPIYRAWVRVLQGSSGLATALVLQEDLAQ